MANVPMPDNSTLAPNSHRHYEETKEKSKAEKIIEGKANKQKKPMGKQVKEALIGDATEVKTYLLWDVLVPAIKDTMVDLIKAFAEGIFHSNGSRQRNPYVQRNGQTSYVSYSSYGNYRNSRSSRYYDGPGETPRYARGSYNPRTAQDFDQIVYDNRADAENVLNALAERTVQYGVATVADLYEFSGIPSSYTDTDYGWPEIGGSHVDRVRDGYVIRLPRPERLD